MADSPQKQTTERSELSNEAARSPPPDKTRVSSQHTGESPQIPDHKLLRCIGRGAYGEVWLARNVMGTYRAIKVLHRSTFTSDRPYEREFAGIEKFEPVSRSHEGLVDILHVGRNDEAGYFFYVMELADDVKTGAQIDPDHYEPKTLQFEIRQRGRLSVAECLRISLGLTNGLGYLHEQGLVHRDIKPSNIIFVKGVPKLADIGLVCGTEGTQSYVGTEGYIPPEGPGSPQADLYSLGKVFYEMSTGKSREYFPDLPTDLREHAEGAAMVELNEVLLKACAADRRERYRTARDMETELSLLEIGKSIKQQRRRQGYGTVAKVAGVVTAIALLLAAVVSIVKLNWTERSSPPTKSHSIAVIPFDNFSAEASKWFADAMTDQLIMHLGNLPSLEKVIPRTSSYHYKNKQKSLPEIALELGVDRLVEGSVTVLEQEKQVRITVALLQEPFNKHLWQRTYTRPLTNIIELQSEVALDIAREIGIKLSPQDRSQIARKPTDNPEAYSLYLQGRFYWNEPRSAPALKTAIKYFEEALRKDTNYAIAYTGLADAYSSLAYSFVTDRRPAHEVMPKAKLAAETALKLDDSLAEAHTSLAKVKLSYEYDLEGARKAFERAIDLNPNSADAHHWYSHYLMAAGRIADSEKASKLALELEPRDIVLHAHMAWHYHHARQYDQAVAALQKALELNPSNRMIRRFLALAYQQMPGKASEAIAEFHNAITLSGGSPEVKAECAYTYAVTDQTNAAIKLLEEITDQARNGTYVSPYNFAVIYTGLGQKDLALDELNKAYEDRVDFLVNLNREPMFDRLRSTTRFKELLVRIGLTPLVGASSSLEK